MRQLSDLRGEIETWQSFSSRINDILDLIEMAELEDDTSIEEELTSVPTIFQGVSSVRVPTRTLWNP